jgi:threonine dehydratase
MRPGALANRGIEPARIREAARVVDPVFLNTPQYRNHVFEDQLDMRLYLKVESLNPIRSFKGRGTGFLLHQLPAAAARVVCASAGNFGQGIAYNARPHGIAVTVFAATSANPRKLEQMRALGAEVRLAGADFDSAKEAAHEFAMATGALFLEDGAIDSIAEGNGTIAVELGQLPEPLHAVVVPLGNGSLILGIGAWFRRASPDTRVIGVCAAGAPAMQLSFGSGRTVETATVQTIADGIAVRRPVDRAVQLMKDLVDEVMLVSDADIKHAMEDLRQAAGIVAEPAAAAGIAACYGLKARYARMTLATVITGSNV